MLGNATRSGSWLLCLIPALGLAAAVAGGSVSDFVEMEVLGVLRLESDSASLLVLREKGADTMLPIFVGKSEGAAIDLRLKQPPANRPQGSDLLAKTIDALGGTVTRVEIESVQAPLFTARVTLQQGDKRVQMEARPSDSVGLALASRAPIFAARALMAQAGFSHEDLARTQAGPGAQGKSEQGQQPEQGMRPAEPDTF
jgi:bifunctional DNase/RNase